MSTKRWMAAGAACALLAALGWMLASYLKVVSTARRRVASGSEIAQTKCGPIEYAVRGEGPPVLLVHGAGGGFDQGLLLGEPLVRAGFRAIAMSRFGYLRTPLPADATAEAQADAHACLLDALQVDRAAVVGISAGGPSTVQFCLRHAGRCAAMVLLVPMIWGETGASPIARKPPAMQRFIIDHMLGSDFVFWSATRLFRGAMVESILGTPIEDVKEAAADEQRRVYGMLDLIQPISLRQDGLRNEGAVAQSLRRYELERIAAPTLVGSAEDDLYLTYGNAKYTAEHIPGARFIGYARGGHMNVGHDAESSAELVKFLRGVSTPAVQ